MPAEDNKAVVRRFVEEFKNKARHDIVDQLCAPSFVHHFKDPRLPGGREGLKVIGRTVAGAFPDVRVTIEDLLGDGDKVIERTSARGTHRGEFYGIPPTNKPVAWTEIHIYRLSGGKIAELWSEFDSAGLLMQLGALQAPEQARSGG